MKPQNTIVFLTASFFCALAGGMSLADHILKDGKNFDHTMYSSKHHRNVHNRSLALECDSIFAEIGPDGFSTLDIGHRRHFVAGNGTDLTVFTDGGVRYEVLIATLDDAQTKIWVGESGDARGEFDISRPGEYQYVRVHNLSRRDLRLDCVWAHNLEDHPVAPH